jgi:hypothetical protein
LFSLFIPFSVFPSFHPFFISVFPFFLIFFRSSYPSYVPKSCFVTEFNIYDSDLTSEITNPFRYFDRTPWTGDRPIAKLVPTQHSTDKCVHITIPRTGFESTISVFGRSKTIRALDSVATGTADLLFNSRIIMIPLQLQCL